MTTFRRRPDGLFVTLDIPLGVLAMTNLTLAEKMVLGRMLQCYNGEVGASQTSVRNMELFLYLPMKVIVDAIHKLELLGLIGRNEYGYIFYDHPCYDVFLRSELDDEDEEEEKPPEPPKKRPKMRK